MEAIVEYAEFTEFEAFQTRFGKDGVGPTLQRVGTAIETLPQWDLENLVHILYEKWPQNTAREILIAGIKRAVQTRFYQQLYHREPSSDVLARNTVLIQHLNLRDTPYVAPEKQAVTEEHPKKKRSKPQTEFGQKISDMNLEQVINWALEVGVPQERIDKHKAKPLGLAKMNISNLIRGKLKD